MDQRRRLIGECSREAFVRMAKRGDADARDEIQVGATGVVEQTHAGTTLQDDRKAAVGLEDVLRFEGPNVWCRCTHRHPEMTSEAGTSYVGTSSEVLVNVVPGASSTPCVAPRVRPFTSRMLATPWESAMRQADSLAIIPAVAVPLAISSSMP